MTALVFMALVVAFLVIIKVGGMNGTTSLLEKLGVSIIGASCLAFAIEEAQGVQSHLSISGLIVGAGLLVAQSVAHSVVLRRYEKRHRVPTWVAAVVGKRHHH